MATPDQPRTEQWYATPSHRKSWPPKACTIGRATNNVAEYRGLIAGLEMARELDPTAVLEVRMDSRLVIEQMAGRWKVKHADMKPLALAAARLRPATVIWTWVPRELNKVADRLVNRALDGEPVPRHYLLDRPG